MISCAMSSRSEAQARLRIDQLVEDRREGGHAPSLVLGWWSGEALSGCWLKGNDVDEEAHSEPGLDTGYRIASCTKSFTAAAVLILVERGVLDVSDPVLRWIPELRLLGHGAPWRELSVDEGPTLHHLMSMCAGLSEDNAWADRLESLTRAEMVALMTRGFRLARPVGSQFEYSNVSYALLGQVIERASGVGYRDFVQSELLEPLNLRATGFEASALAPHPVVVGYSSTGQKLPFSRPGAFSAIGGLFSTARDLARWSHWLAAGFDPLADDRVLSRMSRRVMQSIHTELASEAPQRRRGYGYGLQLSEGTGDDVRVWHSGGYPGFSSQMRWHLGEQWTLVGFENQTYANVGNLLASVEEVLNVVPPGASPEQLSKADRLGSGSTAELWPELLSALGKFEEFARTGEPSGLRAEFAINVELDEPWDSRAARFQGILSKDATVPEQQFSKSGAAMFGNGRRVRAHTSAAATVRYPLRDGFVDVDIALTPEAQPKVQTLEIRGTKGSVGGWLT